MQSDEAVLKVDFKEAAQRDLMRQGPGSWKAELGDAHPVQTAIRLRRKTAAEMRRDVMAHAFGAHMVIREDVEQFVLGQPLRLPGLHSHQAGLHTLRGDDELLTHEDILQNPAYSEVQVDVHASMERRLGLKVPTLKL